MTGVRSPILESIAEPVALADDPSLAMREVSIPIPIPPSFLRKP
jgi:hypothetical protein